MYSNDQTLLHRNQKNRNKQKIDTKKSKQKKECKKLSTRKEYTNSSNRLEKEKGRKGGEVGINVNKYMKITKKRKNQNNKKSDYFV